MYSREILTLADGGEIGLDWLETGCDLKAPVILILPGLTGESQAEYIKCLALSANNIGVRCVVFNNRGLAGVQLKVTYIIIYNILTTIYDDHNTYSTYVSFITYVLNIYL